MNQFIAKIRAKKAQLLATAGLVGASVTNALAVAPTDMDGVVDLGTGYLTKGTTYAVGAAILGFGWVGYQIAKKYVKGAKST